jgi:ATP-dependent DNA helicase Rep
MGIPSRFISEMKLNEGGVKEDPREKLKRLREAFAAKGKASDAAQDAQKI